MNSNAIIKKHEYGIIIAALLLLLLYTIGTPKNNSKSNVSFEPFNGFIECYNPRDFIDGEQDGGTFTIIQQPDNGGLTNAEIAGDNPCIEVRDCGLYLFDYCVECAECEDLIDCLDDPIRWCIPCITEFTITCN